MNNRDRVVIDGGGDFLKTHYKEIHEVCSKCSGTGRVKASKDDVVAEIYALSMCRSWKFLLAIYRDWKANGETLPCIRCDGKGEVVYCG